MIPMQRLERRCTVKKQKTHPSEVRIGFSCLLFVGSAHDLRHRFAASTAPNMVLRQYGAEYSVSDTGWQTQMTRT